MILNHNFYFCRFRQYVVDYKCTNDIDSSWFVRDASKSFPSGHSSTSFYEAVFLIWYENDLAIDNVAIKKNCNKIITMILLFLAGIYKCAHQRFEASYWFQPFNVYYCCSLAFVQFLASLIIDTTGGMFWLGPKLASYLHHWW